MNNLQPASRSSRFGFLLACLGAVWLAAPLAAEAAVWALAVGIDDYPGDNRLVSCVNDARGFAALLTGPFGVPAANVRLLLNTEASSSGIRQAFSEHLLKQSQPGDEVVFFFSGHGALVPNWGPGSNRLMKVLVAYSREPQGRNDVLSQSELKDLLGQLTTTNITVALDCCHAGSMTRAAQKPLPENHIKVMNLGFGPAEKFLQDEPHDSARVFSKSAGISVPVLWLGACLSNQVSYCGRKLSRFTGTLVELIQKNPQRPLSELFPLVQAEVEKQTSTITTGVQTPVMEGPATRPLVATKSTLAEAGSTPAPESAPTPSATSAPPPSTAVQAVTPAAGPSIAPPSDQPFPLMVQVDRNQYYEGDAMKVRVMAGADCYLRLYIMNAATEIQQLFPNQHATNNFVRRNEVVEIPAPDTFVLRTCEPFGNETLLAVAATQQFSDLFKLAFTASGFQDVGAIRPAQTLTRGIRIEAARPTSGTVSYSSVQYSVQPRPN